MGFLYLLLLLLLYLTLVENITFFNIGANLSKLKYIHKIYTIGFFKKNKPNLCSKIT